MIRLEYIIAQHQDGNVSVAINSKKSRQENPAINIIRTPTNIVWELQGLHVGEIETIAGDPRATRIDFYISMEDLKEQRINFLVSTGVSLGNQQGLRNPVGTERRGGTQIRWAGAVGRLEINDVDARMPPFKFSKNPNEPLVLNIDREISPYPIISSGGGRTTRELHFGVEHTYTVRRNNNITIPRINLIMTEDQYATILDFIDRSITFYDNM